MAVLRDDLTRNHAQRALMSAMRASYKCLELRRVTITILKIFERAQQELPLPNVLAWKKVTEDLRASIAGAVEDVSGGGRELRTALSASVSDDQFSDPYRLFVYRARTPFPVGRQPARLDLLLIVLMGTAAGAETTLSEGVANGMRQAYKAIAKDSRTHWRGFADKAPLDLEEIDALLQSTQAEVVKDFLRQLRVYLLTPIAAPRAELVVEPEAETEQGAIVRTKAQSAEGGSPGKSSRPGKAEAAKPPGAHEPRVTVAPTIAAALREAQLSPLGAKAGVGPLWDLLTPGELSAMTRKLHADLVGDDLKRAVIAVIALVALLASSNPKAARLMETCGDAPSEQAEIWINVKRGWICWWQQAYTDSVEGKAPSTARRTEVRNFNIIPMPESLATQIHELHLSAGSPKHLITALDHPCGHSGLLMAEVNSRLKELGDQVHLAEPTRFSSSLGMFVLKETGSDMAAGHLLQFPVCPTSAPFYFSPRTNWLAAMFTRLYERLGLGRPVNMEGAPARQGAGVGHETAKLRSGFNSLVEDVIRLSDTVQTWASDGAGIEAIAQLAPRCAELFHIPIGGRGSEPERITIASVIAGHNAFALMDKLTDGDKSARVLPHTALTSAVIGIFLAARHQAEKRLGMRSTKKASWDQPVFATIELNPEGTEGEGQSYVWKAIEASAIRAMAKRYYSAELNFQRGLLVTEMGEDFVNRWLIRSMTGHGSYLTRAFAPSMGVAPAEAVGLLRTELQVAQQRIFGEAERLIRHADQLPELTTPSLSIGAPQELPSSTSGAPISSDPLLPLDAQCLIDWRFVEDIREHLAAADGSMAADIELLLSALAFSGLPTVELALDLVLIPQSLKTVGSIPGVVWRRQHYLVDLWLPLQRPTRLALQHRGSAPVLSRQALIDQAAQALRIRPGYHGWPTDALKALTRFKQACDSWRRIEFPPYLCAVALPSQESACLSHRSLNRLANGAAATPPDLDILSARFKRGDRVIDKVHGLKRIGSALHSAATNTESKGRVILRGQVLNRELDKLSHHGTAVYHFLTKVYRREAHEMVNDLETANDASSTYTRFSALWPTFEALPWDSDPDQFDEKQWVSIIESVNAYCIEAMVREDKQYTTGTGAKRSARAQDALQRLFHILSRDGYDIPDAAWEDIGGAVVRQPRISASSTVIFDEDAEGICDSFKTILADEPLLVQRMTTKVRTMAKAPLRLGEASCVPFDCITQFDALAIPVTPFDVDKSSHAPRLIPLPEEVAQLNRALGDVSRAISPGGKWMYRFDDDATQDDQRGNRLLADLIRLQTGEPFARPQSLRANAYEEFLWPGWRPLLTRLLKNETTAQECLEWIRADSLEKRWTRPISAAVAAGHGAVDPGLLHYASAWPQIYAVYYEATLTRIVPGQGWLERFKLRSESMGRARRRAGRDAFDAWRWLESGRCRLTGVSALYEPPVGGESPQVPEAKVPVTTGEQHLLIHSCTAIVYLVLRALGLNPHAAAHESAISGRVQEIVEPHRLGQSLVAEARKRNKPHQPSKEVQSAKALRKAKAPKDVKTYRRREFGGLDVSQYADIDLLLEREGETMRPVIQWTLALLDGDASVLDALFRRDGRIVDPPETVRTRQIWKTVTRGIPPLIELRLRFGQGDKFLSAAEQIAIKRPLDPWFLDNRHPSRGQLPDVSVRRTDASNPVMDRRMTSVVRLIVAARLALNRAEAHYLKRKSCTSTIYHLPRRERSPNA